MAQNKITIQFQGKGHKKLRNEINAIAAAQERLNGETKKTDKSFGLFDTTTTRNRKNISGLGNAFATVRSKMLLLNFAMGLGVQQLVKFAQQAAQIESMARAFNTLSGGVEGGSVALEKLKNATDGTMDSFSLFQQANNAMILGVSRNSDEMAEMFDIAQRLGRALGRDTASSVESLITGIGRQSRLMLDNIGIIVKSDEAYEDYAQKLGTTADKLSDADKKTAFLQATMESARQKVLELGDEVLSSQDKFDQLTVKVTELTIAIGDKFKDILIGTAEALGIFDDSVAKNTITAERNAEVYQDLIDAYSKFVGFLGGGARKTFAEALSQQEEIGETEERVAEAAFEVSEGIGAQVIPMSLVHQLYLQTNEAKKQAILDDIARLDILANEIGMTNEMAIAYDNLQKRLANFSKENEDATVSSKFSAIATNALANEISRLVIEGENLRKLKLGEILGNIAIKMGISSLVGAGIGFITGGPAGAALGAKAAIGIAHTGGHIKEDGSVQRFANGGVVQGQDNVPILAQAGEFVMQRSAVESVGLETMNRINQGGSAGNVTINVTGNVMSQDYVEGELASQLREAIRRGTDIGVS